MRSASTVRWAATSDWASTCPPKTRPCGIHWLGPVKMSSLVRAPVSVQVEGGQQACGSGVDVMPL